MELIDKNCTFGIDVSIMELMDKNLLWRLLCLVRIFEQIGFAQF
jgi:hypothetical protein